MAKEISAKSGLGFKLTPDQEGAFVSQLSGAMDEASACSLRGTEGPSDKLPRQDISRRLGIVEISEKYFAEFIEKGFPLPPGTHVRGVKHDDWGCVFQCLICHESFSEVPEGSRIPLFDLVVDTVEKTSRFRHRLNDQPSRI